MLEILLTGLWLNSSLLSLAIWEDDSGNLPVPGLQLAPGYPRAAPSHQGIDGINGFSLAMNEKLLYVKEKMEELNHLVRDLGVKLDIPIDPRITLLPPRGGSLLVNSMPHGHAASHLVW